jgi:protein-L-isoaspartate O-methyltransferase
MQVSRNVRVKPDPAISSVRACGDGAVGGQVAEPGYSVATVNKAHLEFCSSPEWARLVEDELLPWVLDGCELGDDLLEVGPGPGLTTDVLRRRAARVTAVELDLALAGDRVRFAATR